MIVTKLSEHGYKITEIFDQDLLEHLITLTDTFVPDSIRLGANPSTHRHSYSLPNHLQKLVIDAVAEFNISEVLAVELWRDYPGYESHFHFDDPAVQNIMIIYLDGNGSSKMGTGYVEDKIYSVYYEKNCGLVLRNSNNISHGMIGSVIDVAFRKAIYINWIGND